MDHAIRFARTWFKASTAWLLRFIIMMKAVRKIEPEREVVGENQEPKIRPSQVPVEIKATPICGSELHICRWDEQTTRWKTPLPMTVGHEFSGKVVEIGTEVKSLQPGDNVAGESHIPRGICYYCKTGNVHVYQTMLISGLQTVEGIFAKYAVVPEIIAYRSPTGVSYEQSALLEPFGMAMHASKRTLIEPGCVVLVMGSGAIGIFAQQIASASGASTVTANLTEYS